MHTHRHTQKEHPTKKLYSVNHCYRLKNPAKIKSSELSGYPIWQTIEMHTILFKKQLNQFFPVLISSFSKEK